MKNHFSASACRLALFISATLPLSSKWLLAQTASVSSNTAGNATGGASTVTAATSYADRIAAMTPLPGFMPLYWDAKAGKLWLEISRFDTDFLYIASLPAGVGSNDIGLDRGQLGQERLVRFLRSGPRVLLIQRNLAYRAEMGTSAEKRAVEDSFAQSVLAGFEITAEEGERVLVDASEFFLRDAHDVAGVLKETKQGSFAIDPKRSAFHLPRTKNFPLNTEVEVMLTFAGNEPGEWLSEVAPDPRAVTVREHHSFIQLPEPGYEPRLFDPRAGYFSMSYADYSTPINQPFQQRFITRHRLVKKNPTAERSAPVKPITYYLDPATPEPIRSALLDGARWWNQAFEAAGFVDAFRVEMLPEDADPMDVRYNVIQWVHRATRGWSYGSSIIDPRTGEILKGHVTLGSLRVRQDYLIAEGLLAPYEEGRPVSPEMEKMALSRLRQLAAHEVGHTLGLAHNFEASTAGRASVMDYPHPFAQLRGDGSIDLADAYTREIGPWDKVAIDYGYRVFATSSEASRELPAILDRARANGLSFLTDQDARPLGSAHPTTHLWDNGSNAIDELQRVLSVRAAALSRFGLNAIAVGRPVATLEETLVPLYLAHRYQLEAAAKSIGGVNYTYALRGDGQIPTSLVPAGEQRRALAGLLDALRPEVLRLPESLLTLIPPRPAGYPRHRELFNNRTGGTFDALAPAEAAASLTLALILHPDRAARLVQQHARDPEMPGLDEVIDAIHSSTSRLTSGEDFAGEIGRTVNSVALTQLLKLAADPLALPQVTAVAYDHLARWQREFQVHVNAATAQAERVHFAYGVRLISSFFENPKEFAPPRVAAAPPGQPIGTRLSCDEN